MPFRRHRPDDRPELVDPDRLSQATAPFTKVDRPDSLRIVRHPKPLTPVNAADWELEIVQWIDELHAAGALDEGTFAVADKMIDTRLAAELALVDDEVREGTAIERGLLRPNDVANAHLARNEVEDLRERRRRLHAEVEVHTARLQGREPAIEPDDLASVGPAAAEPRPLPAPSDLNDLHRPPVLPA
ncbi:hypothetical protein GCM10023175_00590 [Pseudonocardia xishanensis]|uniref:Uncharacterized protein n=2 Tax=Pseudonocardia xishanensis TaxID=630995 RepID=A0ABP8RD14_9PSEU